MYLYFVTYDVVENQLDQNTSNERDAKIQLILRENYGGRQTLLNQWCVRSKENAQTILEELKSELGLSDRMVVVEWLGQMNHYWTIESISDWS
jgi:hypothetical protein